MAIEKSVISTGQQQYGKKLYQWEVTEVKILKDRDDDTIFRTIKIFTTYAYNGALSRDYAIPFSDRGLEIIKEIMALAEADIAKPKVEVNHASATGDDIPW